MGYKGMIWFSVRVTSTSWPSVAASVAMITRAVECPTSVVTSSPSISQPTSSLRLECLRLTTERATEHAWKLNRRILWNLLTTQNQKLLNYLCWLRFSFLLPYWLFPCNTITFHKYFWCSRFCEFHCKTKHFTIATKITSRDFVLTNQAFKNVLLLEKLSVSCVKLLDERPLGKHRVFIPWCSPRTAERNI